MVQQVSWNVTVNATSPLLVYKQGVDMDGVDLPGWQTRFSDGEVQQDIAGTLWGFGTPYRVTTSNDTVVKLQFEGTAAWLFGIPQNIKYMVTIDREPVPLPTTHGLLASVTGLEFGNHTLVLRTTEVEASSILWFQKAVFSVPSGVIGGRISDQRFDNLDDDIVYGGFGVVPFPTPQLADANIASARSVHISNIKGDWASFQFRGQAVWVDGITNDTYGTYEVSLDGGRFSQRRSGRTKQINTDALLYYQGGLDPTKVHTITIRNVEDKPLVLTGIRTLSVEGGEPVGQRPPLPMPAIIGIAVGAAVMLLVGLGLTIFLLLRRRSRGRRVRHAKSHKLDLNQDVEKGFKRLDSDSSWSDRRRGSDATLSPFILERMRTAQQSSSPSAAPTLLPPAPALAPPVLALDTRSLSTGHSQPRSALASPPDSLNRSTPSQVTPLQTSSLRSLPPVHVPHGHRPSIQKADLDWQHGPGALLASFERAQDELEVLSAGTEGPPPEYRPRDR